MSLDDSLWKDYTLKLCQQHGIIPTELTQKRFISLSQGIQRVQKIILHTDEYDPLDASAIVKHFGEHSGGRMNIGMFLLSQGYQVELHLPSFTLSLLASMFVSLNSMSDENVDSLLKLGYRYTPSDGNIQDAPLFYELAELGVIHGTTWHFPFEHPGCQGSTGPQGSAKPSHRRRNKWKQKSKIVSKGPRHY